MELRTLAGLFLKAASHDKPDCLLHKVGGSYVPQSTAELVDRVRRLAAAIEELGVGPGDRVALMAENGPHWPTVDFATLCMGGVLVPVYPTLSSEDAAYVINDCGARIAFVQGIERLEGLLGQMERLPQVETWVAIDGMTGGGDEVLSFERLIAEQQAMEASRFEERAQAVQPDDVATLIYTSGTTGKPKGVMLTHHNIASNVEASLAAMELQGSYTALSFLPLSHSFERTIDYIYFHQGLTVAYAESVQTVAENMQEVRPHVFVSVPRVYEKVLARVHENVDRSSPIKQRIFRWALGVARDALPYRLREEDPPGLLGVKLRLADKLVFDKLRQRLGGRFEFAMSGGAPLAREIAEFFWGAGIRIYEGYGLTETAPVLTVNRQGAVKLGTVGPPIDGVELRIAEDGEILARGPNIMRGYYNLPEETAEVLDEGGWFRTGDIGELDEDGFLRITDRKKEIIVNAYGKNIAPAPIENRLKASRFVAEAVVIGDRRKFLSALLVPDFDALSRWAEREEVDGAGPELLAHERVRELFRREIEQMNEQVSHLERIRAWELLSEPFTVEGGELTPTQKVKRRVIQDRFGDRIDRMYRDAEAAFQAAGKQA